MMARTRAGSQGEWKRERERKGEEESERVIEWE